MPEYPVEYPDATLTVEPADLLGRYLIGEVVTREQLMADTSPWVRYWLPNYHGRRLQRMLAWPIELDSPDE